MARIAVFALLLFLVPSSGARAILISPPNLITEVRSFPEFPRPGDAVTLTASVVGDSGIYDYVWLADDVTIAEGAGLTKATVKAGVAGSITYINLTIVDARGTTQGSRDFILRPAEVDLVWEAKSYVPPLYQGRPLPNQDSRVSVQAIPHLIATNGTPLRAAQLSYLWSVNGKPASGSGYGQSSVTVQPPYFDEPFTVSVRAQTVDGLFAGENSVIIAPVKPLIVIYEDRPLGGPVFNGGVRSATGLSGDEVTYRAYPVYVQDPAALTYRWTLNRTPIERTTDPRATTFRKTNDTTGSFVVGFDFSNPRRVFENAARSFTVAIQ
jgi:hypothetical protein